MLFYLEQPAFTKSRTPAGGTSAALSLRSNVVGTYGSPTNAPSLYTRRSTENCPPPGEGSFYLLKLGSRVSDCYSASLLIGTPRGCFFYLDQPAFTKSRTPAGGGSPYTEGTLCFAIWQGLSGVARALLSAGAVPPQTPPPFIYAR